MWMVSLPVSLCGYGSDPPTLQADTERRNDGEKGKLYERERGWNNPKTKSPGRPVTPDPTRHHHSNSSPSQSIVIAGGRASPFPQLARKGSAASLRSDDGTSSRASSVSSRSECTYRFTFCFAFVTSQHLLQIVSGSKRWKRRRTRKKSGNGIDRIRVYDPCRTSA